MYINLNLISSFIPFALATLHCVFSSDIIGSSQLVTHNTDPVKGHTMHHHFLADTAHKILQELTFNDNGNVHYVRDVNFM